MEIRIEHIRSETVDIDVSKIEREYKWLAIDRNGRVFVYKFKPKVNISWREWALGFEDHMDDVFVARELKDERVSYPVDNWKQTLTEIIHPEMRLPIKTLVVFDAGMVTRCAVTDYRVGVIHSYRVGDSAYPYEATILKSYNSGSANKMEFSLSDKSIIAAFDPNTGEQIKGADDNE